MMLCCITIQIPDSIRKTINNIPISIDEENALTFIKFKLPEEIEFFKSLDWILDYNQMQVLSKDEIENNIRKILETFKPIDKSEAKVSNIKKDLENFEILKHKVNSLALMLEIKQGKKTIILPSKLATNSCPKENTSYKIITLSHESNITRKKIISKI